jgi:flagellar biogenesis protein FliO
MMIKFAILVAFTLVAITAQAGVKVTSLDLQTTGATGLISISLEGRSGELPDLRVHGQTIEVVVPEADAFSAITKNIRGAMLSANVLNGKAIIKAILPYAVSTEGVNLGWNNKNIEVVFPRGKAVAQTANVGRVEADRPVNEKPSSPLAPENKILKKVESSVLKESLNENYLNKLMHEDKQPAVTAKTEAISPSVPQKTDEVKTQQAAIASTDTLSTAESSTPQTKALASSDQGAVNTSDSFSFAGYAAKFGLFLALVLGLFYGIVQLLKKGVFNKGKLGFLNNSQMIQVLSTTYVAPKRSLMVVKAHKQIFLVANAENGIQFLAEMTDTPGLIKEGEKLVTGTNFDLNLGSAETQVSETVFKLKENINESTPITEEKGPSIPSAKDIVKFSEELKKKAKKLKPIEFN